MFSKLKESWENMAELPQFSELEGALWKGLANLDKWYRKVNDTDAYFICLVLDPNFKTAYAESKWQPEIFEAAMERLGEVFDSYYTPSSIQPNISAKSNTSSTDGGKAHGQYGYAWMRESVHTRHDAECGKANPHDEYRRYLESPLKDGVTDVIGYWGKNSGPHHYPTWAHMARDYLAIQGSATPSECAFSSGGITGTACRSCLTVEMFEALQILKSAYWGGHIMAADDAEMQVTANAGDWETLVVMEVCTDDEDGDAV